MLLTTQQIFSRTRHTIGKCNLQTEENGHIHLFGFSKQEVEIVRVFIVILMEEVATKPLWNVNVLLDGQALNATFLLQKMVFLICF